MPIDRSFVDRHILESYPIAGLDDLLRDRPSLFAGTAVFVSASDLAAMRQQIKAIEAAARLGGYASQALKRSVSPAVSAQPGTHSVFMGYDFHLTVDGPRLIEVNTNAGGAFLVEALNEAFLASQASCGDMRLSTVGAHKSAADIFVAEWQAAGRTGSPKTVAIVDEDFENQYLYPDMLLAKFNLEKEGIKTLILGPEDMVYQDGGLIAGDLKIDFVYNRLTDFALTDPVNSPIRKALEDDVCVVSPSPRHHALWADKRNLIALTDLEQLRSWGLADRHVATLSHIPETLLLSEQSPEEMWARRKDFFFKPAAGFGSRGTYRGDKITKRVWSDILAGDYVAQSYVPPGLRGMALQGEARALKYDIRVFTYAGEILSVAARIYQGQTTNFRTEGGGFAPVVSGAE